MPELSDDLLLDHEYDGIKELDNKLPGWWLWLFWISIVFGLIYAGWFHILGKGPTQAAQYESEVAAAHAAGLGLHYESWGPDVEPATDAAVLADGETLFKSQCAVCHGQLGEGMIGPNFTDDYFLHGAAFADSIRVIEEGVPEQGMISWKTQLSRQQVLAVGTYVFNLRGTNPPNPKEPQGTLAPSAEPPEALPTDGEAVDSETMEGEAAEVAAEA